MSYKVSAQDLRRVRLNMTDTVAAVLQNVAIILSTRQQTVPLYRGFGLPMRFVDKPIHIAQTIMVAEIDAALRQFEPRATVRNITFAIDPQDPGKLIPTVEVDIADE